MRLFSNIIAIATVMLAFATLLFFFSGDKQVYGLLSHQNPVDEHLLTGMYDFSKTSATFNGYKLPVPLYKEDFEEHAVLGATNIAKRIEVDLTHQRLYAFEGENKIYDFSISSGRWNPTPKGIFKVWIKLRYANMSGGSKLLGTDYDIPNVPYVMFFYNQSVQKALGYGIHGVYWHNNFGIPMSHGCINVRPEDVKQLYYWADPDLGGKNSILAEEPARPGTEVIIYGDPPNIPIN